MSHKRNNANSDSESYPELEISSKNTSFIDLKRCFKFCVKDMSKGYLDEKEDSCSCLFFYIFNKKSFYFF